MIQAKVYSISLTLDLWSNRQMNGFIGIEHVTTIKEISAAHMEELAEKLTHECQIEVRAINIKVSNIFSR